MFVSSIVFMPSIDGLGRDATLNPDKQSGGGSGRVCTRYVSEFNASSTSTVMQDNVVWGYENIYIFSTLV